MELHEVNLSPEIGDFELTLIEEDALKVDHFPLSSYCLHLVNKVKELKHELDDPAYQYNGFKIHRQHLIELKIKNAKLEEELKKLKQDLKQDIKTEKI